MEFIVLGRFKKKPTKESIAKVNEYVRELAKSGVKFKFTYWTLGEYDSVHVFEAPDEKVAMKAMMGVSDEAYTTTLVAVQREEAIKLVE